MTTVIGKRTQSRICGSRYRDALKSLDESLHCPLSSRGEYVRIAEHGGRAVTSLDRAVPISSCIRTERLGVIKILSLISPDLVSERVTP